MEVERGGRGGGGGGGGLRGSMESFVRVKKGSSILLKLVEKKDFFVYRSTFCFCM